MNPPQYSPPRKYPFGKILAAFLALLLLTHCATVSTYHQNIEALNTSLAADQISKADFIRQRIKLDTDHGVESSKKWNAAMLRDASMEAIHDPHRYGHHIRLINEALENKEITDLESREFKRLAKEARKARSIRTQKRTMQRARLGYRR